MAFMGLLNGQDTIVFRNKTTTLAKIKEVGLMEVKYKLFSNLDGPDYVIPKIEIFTINYKNGMIDTFKLDNMDLLGRNLNKNAPYVPPDKNYYFKSTSLHPFSPIDVEHFKKHK